MQTIRLRISESVYSHLMWFLKRFSRNEVEIIRENDEFISVQEYLENELETIENGTAEFINLEQLDEKLEKTIRKYED